MGVTLYHRPQAEDLTLADLTIEDQINIGDGTDTHILKAVQETGLGGRLTFGLDETARTLVICDYGDIDTDFGLAAASHPTLYIKSASHADHLFAYHDDTDAYIKWNDGELILQTTEADSITYLTLKPTGTAQRSYITLYDTDTPELTLFTTGSNGYIQSGNGSLKVNATIVQDVTFWDSLSSGNPSLVIHGWNTAGSDLESTELTMDDTNDEFLIQAANSANHEGVTVSLPESSQAFRVRNGSGIVSSVANDGEGFSVSNYGAMQTATGDSTTTIDWGLGNIMYFTFGAMNETFTFTAPANKGEMKLILKQDGTGSRLATWPGTVLWPGNTAPTLTTTAAYVDIVTFIYDGTNYFGVCNYDFR